VTALVASDLGDRDGPAVVLVHGVGIGAWAFDELAASLAADHRVLVVHRRGYGLAPVPASATVAEQVADLLRLVDDRGIGRAVFVGVSGGATLVLAGAMAAPGRVRAAVVHEPVLGPLAPELHAALSAAAARLAAGGGVADFVVGLVGEERMAALPEAAIRAIHDRADVVRAEVPEFIAFAPSAADLAALSALPLVASVGGVSPPMRQRAAAVLAERAGASVEVLAGVRHLPQLEAPAAFEKLIRAVTI
jgi:pimeloyl-ACP methyl ester carboxylesterase